MEGQYYHNMSPVPIRKESIVDIMLKDRNFEPCGAWVNLKVLKSLGFWLRQELKESHSLSARYVTSCLALNLHLSINDKKSVNCFPSF